MQGAPLPRGVGAVQVRLRVWVPGWLDQSGTHETEQLPKDQSDQPPLTPAGTKENFGGCDFFLPILNYFECCIMVWERESLQIAGHALPIKSNKTDETEPPPASVPI